MAEWYVKRLVRASDLSKKTGSTVVVVPVGGGSASKTFTISGLAVIEMVINVRIVNTNPKTGNVYSPQCWLDGGNVVGISLGGTVGTSVSLETDVLGY